MKMEYSSTLKIKEKLNLSHIFSIMEKSQDFLLFKILGNGERFAILRWLMASQGTLSQLGKVFKKSPAHIRHHLKILEQAGLVEFVEARPVQGGPEKYYRATQHALIIHKAVVPASSGDKIGITIGSMDSGIKYLASILSQEPTPVFIMPIPLSSLDGLIALRQGLCQMSTCHLIDPQTGEYNRPFIRHLFPGQEMALIQLYRREEGLMVTPGNPMGVKDLQDLLQPNIVFVNRESGSGVRQWLDLQLHRQGIPAESIRGFSHIVHSHAEIARVVLEGRADTGIGIAATAREFGLDFIPLFEEPYEIVMPHNLTTDEHYKAFFDGVNSGTFRSALGRLDGYAISQAFGAIEIVR